MMISWNINAHMLHACHGIDNVKWELSPRYEQKKMDRQLYYRMLCYLAEHYPLRHLHSCFGRPEYPDSQPLFENALFFDYVVLQGHRYYASIQSGTKHSSLVEVELPSIDQPAGHRPKRGRGELLRLIQFQQSPNESPAWVAQMRWFKPWTGVYDTVWDL